MSESCHRGMVRPRVSVKEAVSQDVGVTAEILILIQSQRAGRRILLQLGILADVNNLSQENKMKSVRFNYVPKGLFGMV